MRLPVSFPLSVAFAAFLVSGVARAEMPQVLALLAAPEGIPVQCSGGRCTVELATLCLQPERLAPGAGQSYVLDETAGLELTVRRPDGGLTTQALPAGTSIEALRTHVAVRLSFPAADAETITGLRIADTQILLPATMTATPRMPDVELARNQRLPLFQQLLAGDRSRQNALSLSRRVINGLAQASGTAAYDRAWAREMANAPGQSQDLKLAAVQRDFCRFGIEQKLYPTPADCLRAQQDGVMEWLYSRFVAALAAGS